MREREREREWRERERERESGERERERERQKERERKKHGDAHRERRRNTFTVRKSAQAAMAEFVDGRRLPSIGLSQSQTCLKLPRLYYTATGNMSRSSLK